MKEQTSFAVDSSLFPHDVVARTAQRYTGSYWVTLEASSEGTVVTLAPKTEAPIEAEPRRSFMNDLLDDRLREQVSVRTAKIAETLVSAALHQALPPADSK